jgi:hypothetical protein
MHYVLIRNEKPEGSAAQIEAVLRGESPEVRDVFATHDIRVGSFIPSQDGSRFMGIREVPIPDLVLEMMRRDLSRLGYGLRAFDSREQASEYWQRGNQLRASH